MPSLSSLFVGNGITPPALDLLYRVERAGVLPVAELGMNGRPARLREPLLQSGRFDADHFGGDPPGDGLRVWFGHARNLAQSAANPYRVWRRMEPDGDRSDGLITGQNSKCDEIFDTGGGGIEHSWSVIAA